MTVTARLLAVKAPSAAARPGDSLQPSLACSRAHSTPSCDRCHFLIGHTPVRRRRVVSSISAILSCVAGVVSVKLMAKSRAWVPIDPEDGLIR